MYDNKLFRCDYRCESTGEGGTLWMEGRSSTQIEQYLWSNLIKEGLSEIAVRAAGEHMWEDVG